MLDFQRVRKSFAAQGGRRVVLEEASFSIPRGQRVGVLGRNGAGKSTLLRLIAGSELPDKGQIHRNGRVSFPIGFTGTFHPDLTGRANVRFLADIYGMQAEEMLDWVQSFAELGHYFDMPVGTYSSGMFARLAFGASFAIDFDLYLVDEAIETGDARFRRKCAAVFETRLDTASLIMVSHNIATIRDYCDVGAVLDSGRFTLHSTVTEAMDSYESLLMEGMP
ncbi:ABC transporter ATP-binding protein [Labrys sp. KB_33_2]|uniref:ABC transporter ATP-binding protein n=1 Tax=Labrys sp. KB_33_2 TaxID=3237479 RepID=UPI003F93372A